MSEYASGCTTEGINKRSKFSYLFAIFYSRGQMKRKVRERRRTKQNFIRFLIHIFSTQFAHANLKGEVNDSFHRAGQTHRGLFDKKLIKI